MMRMERNAGWLKTEVVLEVIAGTDAVSLRLGSIGIPDVIPDKSISRWAIVGGRPSFTSVRSLMRSLQVR